MPPATSRVSGVLRAALFGLAAGLMLGGVGLLWVGVHGVFGSPDCTDLTAPECRLLSESARDLGRLQTLCGGALVALGAALFVLARGRAPLPPHEPPSSVTPT
ncbi:hypothetical protein DRW03_31495 [Corallococcus sp. H22C18031201]|uniref:hypothetical protein n=1 Tax=Citreicoccus inhibens TaxID=2849499 RepID=UPI000E70FDBE|nr:hypothetical protein [Citreicoccus inhibens]MBU8894368.1 hypothetical protein [Citreicoccus inhibens]RJS16204.1 hypothetical protein DRW03_31495 [Corallococcus sp. H22C18031201]